MKKLLFFCAILAVVSCGSDDESVTEQEVFLQLEHYKTTSVLYGTSLLAFEDGALQTIEIPGINGFAFGQGNFYNISAIKRTIKNNGVNDATHSYELIAIQSQDTIPPNTIFSMPLAKSVNGVGYVSWLVGNLETGFVLNNEIDIDCSNLCTELFSRLSVGDNIIGEFEHGTENTYVLKALY